MAKVNGKRGKVAKHPEDRPINSSGWFGLCCYNIPQGTLLVLMPGVIMLCIGVILVAAWYPPDLIAILMTSIGGGMTVGSLLYWSVMWRRYRPQKLKKSPFVQVQLVGVYNINMEQKGRTNPAYIP